MFWKKPKINKIEKDGKQGISIEILTNEKDPEQMAEEMAEKMAAKMTKKISDKITRKFNDKVRELAPSQPIRQQKVVYSDYEGEGGFFGLYVYAILVLIMVLIVGGLSGFLWHESNNKTVNHELIAEINRIKGEEDFFVSAETQPQNIPVNNQLKASAEEQKPNQIEESKYVNARFDSCGLMSNFWTENWYPDLKDKIIEEGKSISEITSACLSGNAGLFVLIIPSDRCESSTIYHFDVESKELLKTIAKSDYECMGSVSEFGKRDGNILKLKGNGEKNGCEWTDYFDYNFLKNTLELKTRSNDC